MSRNYHRSSLPNILGCGVVRLWGGEVVGWWFTVWHSELSILCFVIRIISDHRLLTTAFLHLFLRGAKEVPFAGDFFDPDIIIGVNFWGLVGRDIKITDSAIYQAADNEL